MSSNSLIEVSGLQLLDHETRKPICESLTFQVRAGEIKLVTGVNGVGKSSLLRTIFRNEETDPLFLGTIKRGLKQLTVRFHPQASALQFAIPVTLADVQAWTSTSSEEPSENRWLRGIDLSRPWDSSSGGEKQRVLLSSLLTSKVSGHELLLLDEPTNHLDKPSRQLVAEEIRLWVATSPQTRAVIIVSHDVALFQCETIEMVSPQ